MIKKERKNAGRFHKGVSGNPSGRPPGSRNRATLLLESLLENEGEQLIQKAIEMALEGETTTMRLCLDRLIPVRKDRPIHLPLPAIESVQQISLAMGKVSSAIAEGEITPGEGEVLANVFVAHKSILATESLERRMEELEERVSQQETASRTSRGRAGTFAGKALAGRLERLERRLGPAPLPISYRVNARAWATAFTMDELNAFEARWEASETAIGTSLLDIFGEGTTERQEILRRLEPAQDAIAREITGKSYAELLREEAAEQQ